MRPRTHLGLVSAWLIAHGLGLVAQEPPTCCDAPYRVGFSRELIRSTVPGEGILDASSTCSASGATVTVNQPTLLYVSLVSEAAVPDGKLLGFSVSIEVEGGVDIRDARFVGYADWGGGGGGSAQLRAFTIVDPNRNGGRRGLVAGVNFPEAPTGNLRVGPPPLGTESLIELTLDRVDPTAADATGRIFYADGLQVAPGSPITNSLYVEETTYACNAAQAEARIVFKPFAPFRRGDPNEDGRIDISDAIFVFGYLFLGTRTPACLRAADANRDGRIDISDPSFILNFLFYGGSPPPDPGPPPGECSPGPAADDLECLDYAGCA